MHNPDLDHLSSSTSTHPESHISRGPVILAYALQAAFWLGGIPLIVSVLISYIKREDYTGTWLSSHIRWQIRTFWFWLLGSVIGGATCWLVIGWFILAVTHIWFIYRVVKGWLYLTERKAI